MGIKGLMKMISEEASECVKELALSDFTGRIVAIDASMQLYQFLIAVRSSGEHGAPSQMLMNEDGKVTSHVQGMFNRTIRLMENGLKPVYVFDGKPPTMKGGELAKRTERRNQAKENLKEATESGNVEDMDKFTKRLVRVTPEHNQDVKDLLALMGVPFLDAPCEAEATCAALAKSGKAFAAGTEDMDALTFATPILLRRLTMPASKKLPILQINLEKLLAGLELSLDEFIDLCILCGCDYCDAIRGIGPKKALAAIRAHKSIEHVVAHLQTNQTKGIVIPENWLGAEPVYQQARKLFKEAEVLDCADLKMEWKPPQEELLTKLLVETYHFGPERVQNAIKKLKKAKSSHSQQRLTSFFTVLPSSGSSSSTKKKTKQTNVKSKAGRAVKKGRTKY